MTVATNVCQVLFIRGYGMLSCGESVEEAFYLALNVMSAIEVQVSWYLCQVTLTYRHIIYHIKNLLVH